MKKVYIKLIIFLLPIVILFANDSDAYKKFAFHKITESCSGDFIYHRICEDITPVDVAFLGTSKTVNGVNDLLIRFVYEYYFQRKFNPVVISFCGGGRNIQYAIAKMLFENKKPKILFLELNEFEINHSHISYGVVSDFRDLIFAPVLNNRYYFRDIGEGLKSRLDFVRSGMKTDSIGKLSDHGFMPYDFAGDSVRLMNYKLSKTTGNQNDNNSVRAKYAIHYVDKILHLARDNHCQVIFLYLPSFGYNGNPVEARNYYEQKADIWYPPAEILDNTKYWHDTWHLSRQGADSLTAWIISKLKDMNIPE